MNQILMVENKKKSKKKKSYSGPIEIKNIISMPLIPKKS